jgi:ABC-type polysaccharide/polyol phosphate export permease
MTHLVEAYRAILIHGVLPEHLMPLLILGLCASGLLACSYVTFKLASVHFAEEI